MIWNLSPKFKGINQVKILKFLFGLNLKIKIKMYLSVTHQFYYSLSTTSAFWKILEEFLFKVFFLSLVGIYQLLLSLGSSKYKYFQYFHGHTINISKRDPRPIGKWDIFLPLAQRSGIHGYGASGSHEQMSIVRGGHTREGHSAIFSIGYNGYI